jgi:predicted permease
MAPRWLSRFRPHVRRPDFEAEMAEEMRAHLEQYTEDLVASGVPPAEAARRARMEFGSLDAAKSDCRDARGLRLADDLGQSFRLALRRMRRSLGFTATALATLALCLGANLSLFAVVDSVLLRPLPFPAADRLVSVYNTYPKAGVPDDGCSLTNYYERRGRLQAFAGVAAYREGASIVGEPGSTEREPVARVTPDFFSTLGVGPVLGRAFTEQETTYDTDKVAILTDAYWRRRLGGDPGVLGRTIRVDGFERRVVGILPPGWGFLSSEARLYFPLSSSPEDRTPAERHAGSTHRMIGRLRPGVPLAVAQAEVDAHNARLEKDGPDARKMAEAGFRSRVVPLHAGHVAAVRPILLLVQGGALFLLAIGAVNLLNLLLIRASGRARELAVRRTLGAGRRHVAREVGVETLTLALVGGLLGIGVGALGIRLLGRLAVDRLPLGSHIAFDGRLVVVGLATAAALGLAMAVPVAWFCLREPAPGTLHTEPRGGLASRAAQGLRHGFVVAQMALAFVLLAGAGLLALSLHQAMSVSPGFRPANVLSGQLSLPGKSYPDRQSIAGFAGRLLDELGHRPGIRAAGIVTNVPLSGRSNQGAVTVDGYRPGPGESLHGHYIYGVGGDFFTALGFTLEEGRFLTAADSAGAGRACVVDRDFARRYWPRGGALGRRLWPGSDGGSDGEAFTVVGVVAPAKQAGLTEESAQGAVFYPFRDQYDNTFYVAARTAGEPEAAAGTLRQAIRGLDRELPVSDLRSMDDRLADSLVASRTPALLAALFSAMAVLLTALGTYGVLSYAVAQRRREIGLRMALGARPAQVRGQFLGLALRLLAGGALLGALGAWGTGRALAAILFHVPALHWATLAGAAFLLVGVSLVACLLPSDRAARVSPNEVLAGP